MRMAALVLLAILTLTACAGKQAPPLPPTKPAAACDFRMIDHNRRACAERGATFTDPVPGGPGCGTCR